MDRSAQPYQFSLWSLLVVSTVAALLCSIGASAHWTVSVLILLGVGISAIGFFPLSLRRHPDAGCVFAVVGFLVRLTGLVLVTCGLAIYAIWIVPWLQGR